MKIEEFSDMFDTLLNSYASQAIFGEGASKQEVVLDEYEKSVLLTQAQDIIVKSYFYGNQNPQGQGFDDSIRRQVDFSSLIKTATLSKKNPQPDTFDDRGTVYSMPLKVIDEPSGTTYSEGSDIDTTGLYKKAEDYSASNKKVYVLNSTDVLYILNEKMTTHSATPATKENKKGEYVVVPLNYKEYDRAMSKAFAQPFKKQAWRLFQNASTGFDVQSELIPLWSIAEDNATTLVYKIRYVKRPDPIVLTALPDGLSIDGFTTQTECSLNPIVHMDILNKAVEIALSTRGRIAPRKEDRE